MLNRTEFLKICRDAILETRNTLFVRNQIEGYLHFHKEIKEDNYFELLRDHLDRAVTASHAQTFFRRHAILKTAGIGNCVEIAIFLLVEIALRLQKLNVDARIRQVKSKIKDHGYLQIRIMLAGEESSLWEVDAWDPRIIDVSKGPDETIKNQAFLNYGSEPIFDRAIWASEIKTEAYEVKIRKPIPGAPASDATPPHKLWDKHPSIYMDYSLESAVAQGWLPKDDEDVLASELRAASPWQQKI